MNELKHQKLMKSFKLKLIQDEIFNGLSDYAKCFPDFPLSFNKNDIVDCYDIFLESFRESIEDDSDFFLGKSE